MYRDRDTGLLLPERFSSRKGQRGSIILAAASLPLLQEIPTLAALSDPLATSNGPSPTNPPRVGIRINTNGDLEEATGDTGSPLTFSTVGQWLNTGQAPLDAADWEFQATIDDEDIGDPGTWTGTFASFQALSTSRTFIWAKDATDPGIAESNLTLILRQVSDTGNSASRAAMTYQGEVLV